MNTRNATLYDLEEQTSPRAVGTTNKRNVGIQEVELFFMEPRSRSLSMVTSIEPIKQGYYLLRRLAVSVVVPGQGERLPRRRPHVRRRHGERRRRGKGRRGEDEEEDQRHVISHCLS
jgi:hypothetical protein